MSPSRRGGRAGINLALSQVLNEYVSEADTDSDNDVEMPRYLDFVRAEREYRASPEWTADREYFVENYRDVEPALFTRRGSVHSRRRRHHTLRVNPETAQRMRDTGRSIFAFTAAAIGEYLRRIHRGGDIVIGVPFLNRVIGSRTPHGRLHDEHAATANSGRQRVVDGRTRRSNQPRKYGNCRLDSGLLTETSSQRCKSGTGGVLAAVRRDVLIPHDS